ncbi:hypothetical protein ACQV2B_02715 [Pantoea allii]|uniref:hypothetical protein n=1 Tax=Pantoea allii TaxID=574096 RepID=UPI003D32454C
MNENEQRELIASLFEELVIANGLIKEICTERNINLPSASLERMEKAISHARREMSR